MVPRALLPISNSVQAEVLEREDDHFLLAEVSNKEHRERMPGLRNSKSQPGTEIQEYDRQAQEKASESLD